MSEIRRQHTCPVCGLRFLVAFEGADPLGDVAIRIDCPRAPGGGTQRADGGGPCCQGYLVTQLPTRYRVLPADN